MKPFLVRPASSLKGELCLPADKSIAHRAIIISAITRGKTAIANFPANEDCLATINAFKKLGISITGHLQPSKYNLINVYGKGLYGLTKPKGCLNVADSGTTLRLILGILAGQGFRVRLLTGRSLSHRPMLRLTQPLRMMGAYIVTSHKPGVTSKKSKIEEYPPITIKGGNLKPISYKMPIASAQVKSAVLLAGLYAKGKTIVSEPLKSRDHTERMLKLFKADIKVKKNKIVIKGNKELISPGRISIPGDISSASFFIVLATVLPQAQIRIRNVSLNPSRTGFIRVLGRMGADIKVTRPTLWRGYPESKVTSGEPAGDILVKSSKLRGVSVAKKEIPSLIDELPILMVAASYACGKTIFEGVAELRVKETDRIRSMTENLKKMGADIKVIGGARPEVVIQGKDRLTGSRLKSFGDHRTAMSVIVAGLAASGTTTIDDVGCISKSFPEFLKLLNTLVS